MPIFTARTDRTGLQVTPSQPALDRAKQTLRAAELFYEHAAPIAAVCLAAPEHTVVVAAVDGKELVFSGIWTIARSDIPARVPALEGDGWALIFSPGTGVADVQDRIRTLARYAYRRWEGLLVRG